MSEVRARIHTSRHCSLRPSAPCSAPTRYTPTRGNPSDTTLLVQLAPWQDPRKASVH